MLSSVEKKLGLMILAFLGAAVVIVMLILIPTFKKIQQLDLAKAKLLSAVETKSREAISFHTTSKLIERYKREGPDFQKYLFLPGTDLGLITALEGIANDEGVVQKVGGSNVDDMQKDSLKISVTITGRYRNVISYLTKVEHLPYFLSVNSMALSPLQDPGQVTMNLDLILYVSK